MTAEECKNMFHPYLLFIMFQGPEKWNILGFNLYTLVLANVTRHCVNVCLTRKEILQHAV
jgi:hypothetical protein